MKTILSLLSYPLLAVLILAVLLTVGCQYHVSQCDCPKACKSCPCSCPKGCGKSDCCKGGDKKDAAPCQCEYGCGCKEDGKACPKCKDCCKKFASVEWQSTKPSRSERKCSCPQGKCSCCQGCVCQCGCEQQGCPCGCRHTENPDKTLPWCYPQTRTEQREWAGWLKGKACNCPDGECKCCGACKPKS